MCMSQEGFDGGPANPSPEMTTNPRTPPTVAAALVAALALVLVAARPAPDAGTTAAVVSDALRADVAITATSAIISFDPAATDRDRVRAELAAAGLDAFIFDAVPVAVACARSDADLDAIARIDGVRSVYGDEPLRPAATADLRAAADQLRAAVGTDTGHTGAGVSVAVVDSGLDTTHADLSGRTISNVRVLVSHREMLGSNDPPPCRDFYTEEVDDSELESGHGTHLASLAAGDGSASGGAYAGVAPGARLVGAGMTHSAMAEVSEQNVTFSTMGAIAGLNHAIRYSYTPVDPVKVVLLGWVGEGLHDRWHPIYWVIRTLHALGVTVVAPVGNGGSQGSDCSAAETCTVNPFSVGPYALAVGASHEGDVADYSSRGDAQARTSRGDTIRYGPALLAPGTDVVGARRVGVANVANPPTGISAGGGSPLGAQPGPDYVGMTGTSVAAGQVAGAVALLQEAAREATGCHLLPEEVRELLESTASRVADRAPWEVGAGILDVDAAVTAAAGLETLPPRPEWMCE